MKTSQTDKCNFLKSVTACTVTISENFKALARAFIEMDKHYMRLVSAENIRKEQAKKEALK